MITTQITTHLQDALNRLMQQYKNQPNFTALMTAFVNPIQDLEAAIFSLDAGRQLSNGTTNPAIGSQLDGLGQIVGIPRSGLSDAAYLLFIFGKVAQNFSNTTIPTILNVIGYVFQAPTVLLQEVYPAGISLQVLGTALPSSYFAIAVQLIQQSLGAGIAVVFVGATASTSVFRFAGSGVIGSTNGWGDVNAPSQGGGWITLIT